MKEQIKYMEDYAHLHDIPIMEPSGIAFLKKLIQEHQVASILEIGSAIGYSAIQMASVNPSIQIITIEKDEERHTKALHYIQACQMEDRIEAILQDGLEYQPKQCFDLIFIDAAKAKYEQFFVRYAPFLTARGIIVSDNMEFHGMVQDPSSIRTRGTRKLVQRISEYQTFLRNHPDFTTTFVAVGDGVAVSQKKNLENQI